MKSFNAKVHLAKLTKEDKEDDETETLDGK